MSEQHDELSLEHLKALLKERGGTRVSLYMTTHRAGHEAQQDPIRLRNLVKQAGERLTERGMRAADAAAMLSGAQNLAGDPLFWQHVSDGLVLFIESSGMRVYRLPHTFDDMVHVNERFHTEPLMPLLAGDGRFYVLALSQKSVRFLEGTRDSIRELDTEGMPASLAEALRFDEYEPQVRFHSGTAANAGNIMFYGQGSRSDFVKKELETFFRQVDTGVRKKIGAGTAPLVLAGVEYLLPIYREVSGYPALTEGGVDAGAQELPDAELHRRAWEVVRPQFEKARGDAVARFEALEGTGLASRDIVEIVPAAVFGRVESLLVAEGLEVSGTFDPATGTAEAHLSPLSGDEDLIDLASAHTVLDGGAVHALAAESMPGGASVGAVFRY